jgi:hypothetical protein
VISIDNNEFEAILSLIPAGRTLGCLKIIVYIPTHSTRFARAANR